MPPLPFLSSACGAHGGWPEWPNHCAAMEPGNRTEISLLVTVSWWHHLVKAQGRAGLLDQSKGLSDLALFLKVTS